MAEKQYAFIKDNEIVNTAVFEDPTESLLNLFKEEHGVDALIECPIWVTPECSWDGTDFLIPKPYPSWVLDADTKKWKAPIEYPNDGLVYVWDEETGSWADTSADKKAEHDPDVPPPANP